MKTLSTTHQKVTTDVTERRVTKSRVTETWDPYTEASVLRALNPDVADQIKIHGHGGWLTMPHWGSPVTNNDMVDTRIPHKMGTALRQVHRTTRETSPLLLPGGDHRGRVVSRMVERMRQARPPLQQACASLIPPVAVQGDVLVHTDPHMGNWVVDRDDGTVRLIDWEAAAWGNPLSDIAEVLFDAWLRGFDPDPVLTAYGTLPGVPPGTYRAGWFQELAAALSLKLISSLSHQFWSGGEEAFDKRWTLMHEAGLTTRTGITRFVREAVSGLLPEPDQRYDYNM